MDEREGNEVLSSSSLLRVVVMIYNIDYYEKMLRNNSKTAEYICSVRWKFISMLKPTVVLDYGSGVGWFRAYRPLGVTVDSYDIGNFPQTGINHDFYSVVCFWDVIEHLKSFSEIEDILEMTNYVAVSIPVKPPGKNLLEWKHFKPGEHLNYYTETDLDNLFAKYGFYPLVKGYPECPPREDILSAIYERRCGSI